MWPIGTVFCDGIFEIKAQCANAIGEDVWFIIVILTEGSIGSLHAAVVCGFRRQDFQFQFQAFTLSLEFSHKFRTIVDLN